MNSNSPKIPLQFFQWGKSPSVRPGRVARHHLLCLKTLIEDGVWNVGKHPRAAVFSKEIVRLMEHQRTICPILITPTCPSPRCSTPPSGETALFSPLLTRREKNGWVSNAQGVEGPHFFALWQALNKEGVPLVLEPPKKKGKKVAVPPPPGS